MDIWSSVPTSPGHGHGSAIVLSPLPPQKKIHVQPKGEKKIMSQKVSQHLSPWIKNIKVRPRPLALFLTSADKGAVACVTEGIHELVFLGSGAANFFPLASGELKCNSTLHQFPRGFATHNKGTRARHPASNAGSRKLMLRTFFKRVNAKR